ncbi:unnamed protein product [Danaus chrysippus]|uniref:(African queen) hypothetical protein n=1 Tax=Danaus chrysippus TaxID=151541 RepID=A0A8J2QY04_9NEOP|nr:unnamed protein product [Danaus chrysippus]
MTVPIASSDTWESYIFNGKEYLIQNLPVNWENAKLICQGHHNGSLAVLDTREKAEFMAEALSELQFSVDSVWVGARRASSEDPEGYRWIQGVELKRTASDVLNNEADDYNRHYPMWLNRIHIPVPPGGADCVALERVHHDVPVFMDLPCDLKRAFVCMRDAHVDVKIRRVGSVRCSTGSYQLFNGRLDWKQAAAYCVLRDMALANVASERCLRKLGLAMLKSRPSVESAWIGGRGSLGNWSWIDSGVSVFNPGSNNVSQWPPMRDRKMIKQNGCLQIDRHETRSPVFLEARCERKMQFICYKGTLPPQPSQADDIYHYVVVRQSLFWQHAYDNCVTLNGSLATVDSNDVLIQLLLSMGESGDTPVEHVWISGRLNMSRDVATDVTSYTWYNPTTGKKIPDPKNGDNTGLYMPPWLDDEFTMDSPCLNLDRQDHLNGLVYGLPCDTPQYSICMIEKSATRSSPQVASDGYETT